MNIAKREQYRTFFLELEKQSSSTLERDRCCFSTLQYPTPRLGRVVRRIFFRRCGILSCGGRATHLSHELFIPHTYKKIIISVVDDHPLHQTPKSDPDVKQQHQSDLKY